MRHGGRFWRLTAGSAVLLLLTGCVPQAQYNGTIEQYKEASNELGRAAGALFAHANTVEAETYIDTQAFGRQPLSRTAIDAHVVLSDEGLRFRQKAIAALSAYTVALAGVASGKTEEQIATDAGLAGTGLTSLTTDLEAAIAKDHPDAQTTDFSGVVGAAVSGAGEFIKLVERHHNRAELEASLRKNDPAMKALFELIGADAERLYTRQRLATQNRGDILFSSYASAVKQTPADAAYLLELSDRLKRYRRDLSLLALSDPAAAFRAWEHAHDALVSVLLDKGDSAAQRSRLKQMVAEVHGLAAEAQPLGGNLRMLAQSQ